MSVSYDIKPENSQTQHYKAIVREYLSKDEIHELMQKSDAKATWEIVKIWFWIILAFVMVGLWPNVVTVILALIIIGAKQLGCAIIMHDTSHYSLFKSRKLNDIIGNWFGAYPIIHNVEQYRPYHLQHHKATGTDDDPDLNLTKGYPTTKASLARKFGRDLSGITGVKGNFGVMMMHLGYWKYSLGNKIEKIVKEERGITWKNGFRNLRGPLAANLIMLAICWAFGKPLLYLLWPAAYLTTYLLILRVRSMAEHSMVADRRDPLQNSRTIHANWLERFLFAPLDVNYHLEHHLLFTIPSYNFKAMHKKLWERGLFEKANYSNGYWNIIKMAAKKSA
ncbi:MAG: fatty acid desaturase family protein [Chitinophagales bacterium]